MFCRRFLQKSLNNFRYYTIEKSPLAALRQKTGYALSYCQKALELHNNDIAKAEHWLREQGQSLGWTQFKRHKSIKGLVGVLIQKNFGAMVEVNCETTLVASNERFQQFVELTSKTCLEYLNDLEESDLHSRTEFQSESLKNLVAHDGKKLSDELALMIGLVGENVSLKRAVCFNVPDSVQLIGMAYPSPKQKLFTDGVIEFGIYGTILSLLSPHEVTDELKRNLCLQVIAKDPLKLGNIDQDIPAEELDDETCLIYQQYIIMDPYEEEMDIGTVLEMNEIEILDYQRFQCGEDDK